MGRKRRCKFCSKLFTPPIISRNRRSQRVTCSVTCQNSLNRESKKQLWWTAEEVDELKCVANFGPLNFVAERYNQWASTNGYQKRSQNAIAQKLYKMGFRQESLYEYICLSLLARRLGISPHTVIRWPRIGLKTVSRLRRKKKVYTCDRHVLRFARERPQSFGGIPYSKLFSVLGDEALCEHIAKNYPDRPTVCHPKRRVVCLNNNVIYPSMRKAADDNHVSVSSVWRSCKEQRPLCGLDFRYYGVASNDSRVQTARAA